MASMYDNRDPSGYGPGYDTRPPTTREVVAALVSRWTRNLGAITSVVLILGVVIWGYRLSERAASGLPVIMAPEGPSRLAPDDPGGDMARHVGLAVNVVAASGAAAAGPSQVMLAPPAQILTADDVPMSGVRNVPLVERTEPALPAEAQPATAPTAQVPDAETDETATTTDEPVVSPIAPVAVVRPPEQPYEISTNGPDDRISVKVPGIKQSPRPVYRPNSSPSSSPDVASAPSTPTAAPSSPTAAPARPTPSPAAQTVAVGTRVAQLGSFGTADLAKVEWDRLVKKFGTLMDGKQPLIQETTAGERTLYRLRATGFTDAADTSEFCAAIVATKNNCISTVVR